MSNTDNPAYLWHNHSLVRWEDATVHLTENWWASVGAVFEGMRGYWNERESEIYLFRLDDHLARLANSMKLVRMDESFPPAELKAATIDLVCANRYAGDIYLMPLAYAVGGRSFGGFAERVTNLFITSRPTTSALDEEVALRACFSSWTRISERAMPPRIKALANYRNSQLASYEAQMNGYDTALLLNSEGKVTEGPGSCVFFVHNGEMFTPDLTSGILPSITRDSILQIARQRLGMEVAERAVDRTEAYLADEAFFVGTAAEVTPIASIDGYTPKDGAPGPVTREIRALYRDLVRGADPGFPEWRTPVGLASLGLAGARTSSHVEW